MKFMTMLKAREDAGDPPAEFYQVMGAYLAALADNPKIVTSGGLLPSAAGAQVRAKGSDVVVTHGPFTEATELVGGYAIFEVDSLDEVIAFVRPFIQLHIDHWPGWEGVSEVRQIADFESA